MTWLSRLGARGAPFALLALLVLLTPCRRAGGQTIAPLPTLAGPDDRSGPRPAPVGSPSGPPPPALHDHPGPPVMTLCGWPLARQFARPASTMRLPVIETMRLLGGLEQNVALPSLATIVGMRKPNGWEGGLGALLTPTGSSLVAAAGITQV